MKSKFKGDTYLNGGGLIFASLTSMAFIIKILNNFSVEISDFLILLLFISMALFGLLFVNLIKYIIISDKTLKYYSLLHPLGKTLDLNNYAGKIITTETGSYGEYKVVHLVDKTNTTSLKIMGVFYKNMDEVNDAISLRKIRFSPTAGQYFKLLIGVKVKVENQGDEKRNKHAVQLIMKISVVLLGIGLALFVVGAIVKMVFKLLS